MAFKFNAILNFSNGESVKKMDEAKKASDQIKAGLKELGEIAPKIGEGMKNLALLSAPATAFMTAATVSAMGFEQHLMVLQSQLGATAEEMGPLTDKIRLLAATSDISAESFMKAVGKFREVGMTKEEITPMLSALKTFTEASGVEVPEAAGLLSKAFKSMGGDADKARQYVDALAAAQNISGVSMGVLAEGVSGVIGTAKQFGFSVNEMVSAVATLGTAGVKGEEASQALNMSLVRIAGASDNVKKLFGGDQGFLKATHEMGQASGKLLPFEAIMFNIAKTIANSPDKMKAAADAADIFGIRNMKTARAFTSALTQETMVTADNIDVFRRGAEKMGESLDFAIGKPIPRMVALKIAAAGARGEAERLAAIREGSVVELFKDMWGSVHQLFIEVGDLAMGPMRQLAVVSSDFMKVVTVGFMIAKQGGKATADQMDELKDNQFGGLLQSVIEFSQGFIQGFREIKVAAKETFDSISATLRPFLEGSGMTAREMGVVAAKVLLVAAALAPLIGGLFVVGKVVSMVWSVLQGLWYAFVAIKIIVLNVLWPVCVMVFNAIAAVIAAVSWPVLLIVLAIVAVVAAIWFWWDEIKAFTTRAVSAFLAFLTPIWNVAKFVGALVVLVGQAIWSIIEPFVTGFVRGVAIVVNAFWELGKAILGFVAWIVGGIWDGFKWVFGGIVDLAVGFGKLMFNILTAPVRAMISMLKGALLWLADTTLGKQALKLAGISTEDLRAGLEKLPGIELIDEFTGVKAPPPEIKGAEPGQVAQAISDEEARSKTLSQPPSAKENAAALANAGVGTGAGGQAGGGQQTVKVEVTGKLSGRDLNIVQTRATVDNAERNGRFVAPSEKRRLMQNGAMAPAQ